MKTASSFPDTLKVQVNDALAEIGKAVGAEFGDPANPLLVSVRSGARASMPGMMDTVLNLGLNDVTVTGWPRNPAISVSPTTSIAASSRCIPTSCSGVDHHVFEEILDHSQGRERATSPTPNLTADDWQKVIEEYKELVEREFGPALPSGSQEQLWGAIAAVFDSWNNQRAITYRRLHDIPDNGAPPSMFRPWCSAIAARPAPRALHSPAIPRPAKRQLYGEFLVNAQGEDVVAGIRTPQHLTEEARSMRADQAVARSADAGALRGA